MHSKEQIKVTLPEDVIRDIDRVHGDRDKFVLELVRLELQRRRHQESWRTSVDPLPERFHASEMELDDWGQDSPEGDLFGLVDLKTGAAVRWIPGKGWVEATE